MADFEAFFDGTYGRLDGLTCGRPVFGKPFNHETVKLPLSSLTRHGLVSGTTGTGKSRVVQRLMEQLSRHGVPSLLSDAKGDVTGFVKPGKPSSEALAWSEEAKSFETHFWSASDLLASMRFSLQDVDPALVSRLLELNPTQESHVVLAHVRARKDRIDLHDLDDLAALLEKLVSEKSPGVSAQAVNVVLRKIVELEHKGLSDLFGHPALDLNDLLGSGHHVVYLGDVRKHASIASVLPVFLLYRLFVELPQSSSLKIVVFLDEAHTLFLGSNKSLVELVERILRQIRSQGVGVFFVTQSVSDIPDRILGLLNTKIVFATKAFTKAGLADVRALSQGFPKSDFYALSQEMGGMGVGQSVVSFLDASGHQLPPLKVQWFAPQSAMAALTIEELKKAGQGRLREKYRRTAKKRSARARFESPATPVRGVSAVSRFWGVVSPYLWRFFSLLLRGLGWLAKKGLAMLVRFGQWLFKKPRRLVYFLLLLAAAYLVWTNWSSIQLFGETVSGFIRPTSS
ncbi:DUF853 family protein [Candidatus Micrarchaeota archaeon]|nr:DUF853 family protein [Candidatus Micrarchaeota archaeon]